METALLVILAALPSVLAISGQGTFYDLWENAPVACEVPVPKNQIIYMAAINAPQFDAIRKAKCNQCAHVTGPKGSILVKIVDRCEGCKYGDLDLTREGFPHIADIDQGRVPITWDWAPCHSSPPGPQYRAPSGQTVPLAPPRPPAVVPTWISSHYNPWTKLPSILPPVTRVARNNYKTPAVNPPVKVASYDPPAVGPLITNPVVSRLQYNPPSNPPASVSLKTTQSSPSFPSISFTYTLPSSPSPTPTPVAVVREAVYKPPECDSTLSKEPSLPPSNPYANALKLLETNSCNDSGDDCAYKAIDPMMDDSKWNLTELSASVSSNSTLEKNGSVPYSHNFTFNEFDGDFDSGSQPGHFVFLKLISTLIIFALHFAW